MSEDKDFARLLSEFLALQTDLSSSYLNDLILSFLRGARGENLDPSAKDEIASRLKADVAPHNDVPTFLQNYLHTHLMHGEWPPQAAAIASRYLRRRSGERFVPWRQRQQLIAELDGEPIRGTELGFRQLLYSQGAESAFRWRGVTCFKTNYDLALYTMMIDELRPRTIVELGAGSGGSALFFADMCTAMGLTTEIISIDKTIGEVVDSRVAFIQSDCSSWLEETVKAKRAFQRPCLMVEDFHGDLAGVFKNIDVMLEVGDYLVVEDSTAKQHRISELIADRPYLIDSKYTDFFGINCTSAINSIFVKADASAPLRARGERERLRQQDRAWRQKNKRRT